MEAQAVRTASTGQLQAGATRTSFAPTLTSVTANERENLIQELRRQLDTERGKNRNLEDSYKFRVASFVQRESETKQKVESLERCLNEGRVDNEHAAKMQVVRAMHKDVIDSLDCIQNKTARMLQDQETDLMKAFRKRLAEVAKEHEELKSRKGEHSSELQAKHRKALGELFEAQELAQSLDKKNQQLQEENKKLQERLRNRDDDRQALLQELVKAKKDLARVKAQCKEPPAVGEQEGSGTASAEQACEPPKKGRVFTTKQIEQARLQQTHNRFFERQVSYRETVAKMTRALELERSTSRGLKEQYRQTLQSRSELEDLIRQCLEDVKVEIMRSRGLAAAKGHPLPFPTQSVVELSVHDLTAEDRERVLELVLSQQRVVQLLYSGALQSAPQAAGAGSPAAGGASPDGGKPAWLRHVAPETTTAAAVQAVG